MGHCGTGGRGQYGHGAPVPVSVVGTAARIVACDAGEEGVCGFNRGLGFGHGQCGPRGDKAHQFMDGREQTVVPNALEAHGEHVAHEAPDELTDGQRHGTFVSEALVSHPDLYLIVLVTEDAFIRDGECPPGRQGAWPGDRGNCPGLSGLIKLIDTHVRNKGTYGHCRPRRRLPLSCSYTPPTIDTPTRNRQDHVRAWGTISLKALRPRAADPPSPNTTINKNSPAGAPRPRRSTRAHDWQSRCLTGFRFATS